MGEAFGTATQEDKQWRNGELRSLEALLSRLKKETLERAAGSHRAATGVQCDAFHPEVPPDTSKETTVKL